MTGFEHKCLHLHNAGDVETRFTVEVDFQGTGEFHKYKRIKVAPGEYEYHTFGTGFSAHWLRLTADAATVATAQLMYT
jgi:hypothetical protein